MGCVCMEAHKELTSFPLKFYLKSRKRNVLFLFLWKLEIANIVDFFFIEPLCACKSFV